MTWETIARRELIDRRPWLRVWDEDVRLPDGRTIEGFTRLELPDFAVVVALTTDGRAVVERSYKHGPRRVSLSLPAGFLEPGETPAHGAARELLEKTGFSASAWTALGSFIVDGNRDCGTAHLFLARDARPVREAEAGDLEEIAVDLMPFQDLLRAAQEGQVAMLAIAAALALAAVHLGTPPPGV